MRGPFILVLSMSYAAAIGQLNAMVPELHTGAGHPRRKFSLDEIRTLLSVLGKSASFVPVRFDRRDQRQGFDCRNFGVDPESIRSAHRAIYIAAPGAAQRTDPY